MNKKLIMIILFACIGLTAYVLAQDAGQIPVPVFTDVKVQAIATLDSVTGLYTYNYTISNPATNTGKIWTIDIDITRPPDSGYLSSEGLTIPVGSITIKTFDEEIADFEDPKIPMVPIGIRVPSGWTGDVQERGFAGFSSGEASTNILPGQTQSGFELISYGLPTIRQIEIEPWWIYVEDEDPTPEEDQLARQIEDSLIFHTKTLGPTAVILGSYNHWNQIRDDLNQAIQLGWISDTTLSNTLVTQLASAREAVDANDGTLAKNRLQTLLNTIAQSTSGQRRQEAYDLVLLNVQKLIENTPDTPVPLEPKGTLSPDTTTLPLGDPYTLTTTVINLANNQPLQDFIVIADVTEGPNQGLRFEKRTDSEGKIQLNYTGTVPGKDMIKVFGTIHYEEVFEFGIAEVTWAGGPDLAIELFVPPYVKGQGGTLVDTMEITGNYGSTSAVPSITRYYLSTDDIIDPNQDIPVGEHAIPPLDPMKLSDKYRTTIQLPSDLPEGKYYLGACADAVQSVAELNELNNCQLSKLVVVFEEPSNQPPNCANAAAIPDSLWPPNHRLVPINISGITDPDGDVPTLTITNITQDEPVNGLGDGDTSPDGFISSGDAKVMLRSERSGKGNGRVYTISFTAADGKGGKCNGQVNVGIPHDQGKGATPIDDGQNYDSTLP